MSTDAERPRADSDEGREPIRCSADPRRQRDRWAWIQDRCPQRLQRLYEMAVIPAAPPEGFAAVHLDDLVEQLRTADDEVARAVLAEAETAAAEPQERIDGAERRATTLQGTLAIAASVTLAGAGLFLRDGAVEDSGWRILIVVSFAAALLTLLACALRASQVTGRIFQFEDPGFERLPDRARMTAADAMTSRAADLLRAAAVADAIGQVKVGLLRSAAWWFRLSLSVLAALASVLLLYALVRDPTMPPPAVTVERIITVRPAATSQPPRKPTSPTSPTQRRGSTHP